MVLAQEAARARNHLYLGTEHLLLGLVAEGEAAEGEGVAAQALERMGISADAVRQSIDDAIPPGSVVPGGGFLPFTPRAKRVIELSQRVAREFDHAYIGTEHLLLGLVLEGDGVAGRVLLRLGADLETTHAHITELLAQR